MKNAKKTTYTAYIVRDSRNRKYLNAPTYTGRNLAAWGRIADAHVFSSPAAAQSCASNINRRDPGSKVATVVPIEFSRRG